MEHFYKLCAAWVTNLRSDIFRWARIKLTVIYLLIIGVILAASSVTIYYSLFGHIHTEYSESAYFVAQDDYQPNQITSEENFLDNALEDTLTYIITIDLCIFILSAILSYILAGYTLKPIRKALEAQEAFSSNASHELRTPLSIIRNSIEVFLRMPNPKSEEIKLVLQTSLEEANYMSQTTESLLQIARHAENKFAEKFQLLNTLEIMTVALDKAARLAKDKNIEIAKMSELNCQIYGNANMLERMLFNLLDNSITYTKAGGKIIIEQELSQSFWNVKIIDNGIGISENDLPHVFDRFYKSDLSRSIAGNHRGSGLGLSIVKQIIDWHKGHIEIFSKLGKGTEVTISLPLIV